MTDEKPEIPLTASQRLAIALGRPAPPPMTEQERRAFEAREDAADAEAARLYGGEPGQTEAA